MREGAREVVGRLSGRNEAMVFKLTDPEVHARALALEGAVLFDPSGQGRPFKQWVVVPPAHAELWESFADHALKPAG